MVKRDPRRKVIREPRRKAKRRLNLYQKKERKEMTQRTRKRVLSGDGFGYIKLYRQVSFRNSDCPHRLQRVNILFSARTVQTH